MKNEKLEVIRGSGNIYRDLNMPDADVRQLKAILAAEIIKTLDKNGLSVRKAQSLTGIDAGDFSRIRNADFRRISVERMMAMINKLGSRIEVAVKVQHVRGLAAGGRPRNRSDQRTTCPAGKGLHLATSWRGSPRR